MNQQLQALFGMTPFWSCAARQAQPDDNWMRQLQAAAMNNYAASPPRGREYEIEQKNARNAALWRARFERDPLADVELK